MQAKRIQVSEGTLGVAGSLHTTLIAPLDPREDINFHNIWGGITVEPENADANAQGSWVLWVKRENAASIGFSDAIINGELSNAVIIACGVWSASNQHPFTSESIHPMTSRTLNAGDTLQLSVHQTGISAGLSSVRSILCAHVTRK